MGDGTFKTYKGIGSPGFQYDREYAIRTYPDSEDRKLEALKLVLNARNLFFGIAEDDIGVPPYIYDKNGDLISEEKTIEQRKAIAQHCIDSRKDLGTQTNNDKFALAKLAGAYVNMMGVLADETIILNKYAKEIEEHFKNNQKTGSPTEQANLEIEYLRPSLENAHRQEKENQIKMIELYKAVTDLLPNVRLKNRRVDIDDVLKAVLGEVTKAAIAPNEMIHGQDYQKIAMSMYQMDEVVHWMQGLAKEHSHFIACIPLIQQMRDQSMDRLNLRREDMEARDRKEVEIRRTQRTLREVIDNVTVQHGEIAGPVAEHLRRGSELVYEMIKQGEKPLSVNIVIEAEYAERVAEAMKKLAAKLPPDLLPPTKEIQEVKKAVTDYTWRFIESGEVPLPTEMRLKTALQKLLQELPVPISRITARQHLPKTKRQEYLAMVTAFDEGAALLEMLPGFFSKQGKNRSMLVNERRKYADDVQAFSEKYTPLIHPVMERAAG